MADTENTVPMGSPPAGETAPFQGVTSEERADFQYARTEANPSDPLDDTEPAGSIRRYHEKPART